VGFDQEPIIVSPECRLDKYVAKFCLQGRVQVDLWLFHRN